VTTPPVVAERAAGVATTGALASYAVGLDAMIALLHEVEAVARRQQASAAARLFDQFARDSAERDRLTASLERLDQELAPLRRLAIDHGGEWHAHPAYARVQALRATAAALIAAVLTIDGDARSALSDAGLAQRADMASLEQGEATLSAYRRAVAVPSAGSRLSRVG
jgi:hypothetical protein